MEDLFSLFVSNDTSSDPLPIFEGEFEAYFDGDELEAYFDGDEAFLEAVRFICVKDKLNWVFNFDKSKEY